jgi:hypothetical protein
MRRRDSRRGYRTNFDETGWPPLMPAKCDNDLLKRTPAVEDDPDIVETTINTIVRSGASARRDQEDQRRGVRSLSSRPMGVRGFDDQREGPKEEHGQG